VCQSRSGDDRPRTGPTAQRSAPKTFNPHLHIGFWDTPDSAATLEEAVVRLTDVVIEQLMVDDSAHVLDLGCGVGGPGLRLAARTGARITGVSISADVGLLHRSGLRLRSLLDVTEQTTQRTCQELSKQVTGEDRPEGIDPAHLPDLWHPSDMLGVDEFGYLLVVAERP
jgi:hypothetical protein